MERKPTILLIDVKGIEILSTHQINKKLSKKKIKKLSEPPKTSLKSIYVVSISIR